MSEAGKATRGGRQKSSSQKVKCAACVVAATGEGVPLAQSDSVQGVHAARGGPTVHVPRLSLKITGSTGGGW